MSSIQILEKKSRSKDLLKKISALNELLTIREYLSLQKRLEYAEQLIFLLPKIDKPNLKLRSIRNISIILLSTGRQEAAINYGNEALRIASSLNNQALLAVSFSNLANLYRLIQDNRNALEYYQKALPCYDTENNKKALANTYYNIGICLRNLDDLKKSIENFRKSIKIREELLDIQGVGQGYQSIGEIYLDQLDYKNAEPYFLACYKLKDELKSEEKHAQSCFNLGKIYLELDNFKKADFYLKQCIQYSKDNSELYLLRDSFKMLGLYYEKVKDFENALKYQTRYSDITDVLFDLGNERKLSEIKRRYDLKIKEKEAKRYKSYNKKLKQRIDQTNQQMMEMEKFYEVGKFSASIVHNLNNPLSAMLGGLQLLDYEFREILAKNIKSRNCFEIVKRNAENLQYMIRSITASVRSSQYEVDIPLDLNEIIKRVIEFYKMNKDFKTGVRVKYELEEKLHSVTGQDIHFNQIISNLVKNAFDAMEGVKHKILRFYTSNYGEDRIKLIIEDNGMGISKENIQKIFSSSFTTKAPGKGTGLGLSITKQMVESYQGEILVESEKDIGTRFIIILPV